MFESESCKLFIINNSSFKMSINNISIFINNSNNLTSGHAYNPDLLI